MTTTTALAIDKLIASPFFSNRKVTADKKDYVIRTKATSARRKCVYAVSAASKADRNYKPFRVTEKKLSECTHVICVDLEFDEMWVLPKREFKKLSSFSSKEGKGTNSFCIMQPGLFGDSFRADRMNYHGRTDILKYKEQLIAGKEFFTEVEPGKVWELKNKLTAKSEELKEGLIARMVEHINNPSGASKDKQKALKVSIAFAEAIIAELDHAQFEGTGPTMLLAKCFKETLEKVSLFNDKMIKEVK